MFVAAAQFSATTWQGLDRFGVRPRSCAPLHSGLHSFTPPALPCLRGDRAPCYSLRRDPIDCSLYFTL
jgi:hypothetical protein